MQYKANQQSGLLLNHRSHQSSLQKLQTESVKRAVQRAYPAVNKIIFVSSFIDRESIHVPGVSTIGLFFWFYAGPAIAIRLLGRRLPQRFGTRTVLLVGGVFMASGMFAFTLVHSGQAWKIIIPAILAGCGHGLMFHTMVALTLEKFATEVRATGSTLALMMLDLGTVAGAPALGEIGDRFGFAALFSTIGAFCLAATLLYALLSRPSVR